MKYIDFLGIAPFIALAIGVSSCDKNDAVSQESDNNAFTIKAQIGEVQDNSVSSRATVNNADGKSFMWQNGDKFDIYFSSSASTSQVFAINNETIAENGKSADFVCENFNKPSDGDKYYAFYPNNGFTYSSGAYSFTLPQSVYSQSANNDTEHLKSGLAMVATGNYADIQADLKFEQKTSLFRIGVTNNRAASVTIKSLKIVSTTYACFGNKYTYKYADKDADTYVGSSKEVVLTLNGGTGISVNTNEALKAYTLTVSGGVIRENELFHIEAVLSDGSTVQSEGFFGSKINEGIELGTDPETNDPIGNHWLPGYYYDFLLDLNEVGLDFKGVTISSFTDGGSNDFTVEIQ